MSVTPQDTFLSDQALAAARDIAAGGTPTVVLESYAGGPCSWCDCDVTVEKHDPRFCAGCPHTAELVMRVHHAGGRIRKDVPLCSGHRDAALGFVTAIAQAGGFR